MIPFNKPFVSEHSLEYATKVLRSTHQHGDGEFTMTASKMISDLVGGGHVLLTPSCTHALELAALLGEFKPGDEIILPSFTFTSAAISITKLGLIPVFVDINPITLGIDVVEVKKALTEKTVGISWVNYAGVVPDIEELQSIAASENLILFEDNAHSLGGTFNKQKLGSFGDFATQSFHATKNIQCGEGGALIINNPKYIERAEIIREKGTNRAKFLRGDVQKYEWVDQGSSFLLAEVLSGILTAQLEQFSKIQLLRKNIWDKYYLELDGLSKLRIASPVNVEPLSETAHMFYFMAKSSKERDNFLMFMSEVNISCTFHYQCLHTSKAGRTLGRADQTYVNAESASSLIVRIPLYPHLSSQDIDSIISRILEFESRSINE